ncbi:MAG: 2-oxo acid dehydrogenase subunit E2 [Anaerolineales bacterium]|nr:2-oxo acid dehydrogenase subunit E2 [Anaerolineales bacterium]
MTESTQATARVTLMTEVDATEFVALREQLKAKYAEPWGFAPGYNDLLVIIVANALREFPYMNARFSPDGEAIERLKPVPWASPSIPTGAYWCRLSRMPTKRLAGHRRGVSGTD